MVFDSIYENTMKVLPSILIRLQSYKKIPPKRAGFSVFMVGPSTGSGTLVYSMVQVEPLFSRSSMFLIFEAAFSLAMTWSRLSLKVGAFTSRMTPMATGK